MALEFPTGSCGFKDEKDLLISLNFKAVPYTNKQAFRNDAPGGDTVCDITLPLPKQLSARSQISYQSGETETTGGLFDPTSGGFWESVGTLGGLTTLFKDVTGISAYVGQRPMDERDSIFKGAELRKHQYTWTLVPKCPGDGSEIAQICKKFQTFAYPGKSDAQTYSRVIHPPVWWISALNLKGGGTFRWDMGPLPSVIETVNVETAQDGVFAFADDGNFDAYPAMTRLTVGFVELEPAINTGDTIQSRSQVRGNSPVGGDV